MTLIRLLETTTTDNRAMAVALLTHTGRAKWSGDTCMVDIYFFQNVALTGLSVSEKLSFTHNDEDGGRSRYGRSSAETENQA